MPDASVISRLNGTPRELNQGGTGTGAILFSTNGTTPIVCPAPVAGTLAGGTGTSGYSSAFTVRAWGRCTGGTTTNYTATLYYGTSITASENTVIEASSARAINSENENWTIEVDLVWDATSNKINGRGWSMVGNLVDAVAVIDNQVTGANPTLTTSAGFIVAGTFSSGNASNTAHLDGFEIIK